MKGLFIVGKDAFLVSAMKIAFRCASGIAVVGIRDTGSGMREALRDATPDIVLLDGSEPAELTLDRVAMVSEERPAAITLVLATSIEPDTLEQLLDASVTVALSRSLAAAQLELLLSDAAGHASRPALSPTAPEPAAPPAASPPAARRALSSPLTNRQLEILRCVAEGHTNARIGRDLWVTEQTVKFHLSNIYRKLGVSNRTEASRYLLLNDPLRARTQSSASIPDPAPAVTNGHAVGNGRAHVNDHGFS
jgi:DNA-binding NarL/FixJ family response regulator